MNVLVFASRKGGSGKSTLAAHLAAHIYRPSRRCLLVDDDPQGSLRLWNLLRPSFEGGQMPLIRRLPKRGFNNKSFKTFYGVVNLDDLEKRFEVGAVVNEESLRKLGLVNGRFDGVKVLGRGEITKSLTLQVDEISATARQKIESAGGTVALVPEKKAA